MTEEMKEDEEEAEEDKEERKKGDAAQAGCQRVQQLFVDALWQLRDQLITGPLHLRALSQKMRDLDRCARSRLCHFLALTMFSIYACVQHAISGRLTHRSSGGCPV